MAMYTMPSPRPSPLGGARSFTSDGVVGIHAPSSVAASAGEHKPFPHIRAALVAIARQYKFDLDLTNYNSEKAVDSAFVNQVFTLLDNEETDQLQRLLKERYSISDDEELEQHCLELMHAQHDDAAGVPFLLINNSLRPISRPSSRASTHSARLVPGRPETPISSSAPSSPLAMAFRRAPLASPSGLSHQQPSSYVAISESPTSSPTLAHAHATAAFAQFASSLPSSPLSSPRLLNARASEFKPGPGPQTIPRPLSRTSSYTNNLSSLRAQTPSPDLWAHKATSNLAIAAPLAGMRVPTPSSNLRSSLSPGEDDDDPFDPFSVQGMPLVSEPGPMAGAVAAAAELTWSTSSASASGSDDLVEGEDPESAAVLTDGMTPFDVLSSVFGATLAPSELEEALAANGYDFDLAMQWLVEKALPAHTPKAGVVQRDVGGRVTLVSRGGSGIVRGGRGEQVKGNGSPRFQNGRSTPGGNRVCRYFLAGECLRADCRFSHDLERALCRFWLRGMCAKGEHCEFLHQIPQTVDVSSLSSAMAQVSISGRDSRPSTPPVDEFPALGSERSSMAVGTMLDPSRTRFAAAVKKAAPAVNLRPTDSATLAARRQAMGTSADTLHLTSIVAPRPSPRIRLRPPQLLPTLATGGTMGEMYMAYRARALQLGAARNACLSRAADAWRRGDGAAAKRFSKEGHDLNAKMKNEMLESARKLLKQRNSHVEQAVRSRDASWSDDPADRTTRGRVCGTGLGVFLGVAGRDVVGDAKLTPEERTEALLDLHGLHANEASEILEEFLLALEKEHFYGLVYLVVGEEKHTGTQDPGRGASRIRLATGVRETLHHWGYPWSERDGVICVDPLVHQ